MDKKSNLQAIGLITIMLVVSLVVARYTFISTHPQTLPPLRLTDTHPSAKNGLKSKNSSTHASEADTTAGSDVGALPAAAVGNLMVDISGAVHLPGVYSLKMGSRIVDAIRAAGGSTPDANTDPLNLAELIHDGSKIVVPRHGLEIAGNGSANIQRTVGISSQIGDTPSPPSSPTPSPSSRSAQPDYAKSQTTDQSSGGNTDSSPVNINNASLEELQLIPGVGPATAQHIIEYRNQAGGFRTTDELKNVKGIGDKKFAKMASRVTVS